MKLLALKEVNQKDWETLSKNSVYHVVMIDNTVEEYTSTIHGKLIDEEGVVINDATISHTYIHKIYKLVEFEV